MVIAELTRAVETIISNSDSPRLEAEYIVMDAAGFNRAEYLMKKNDTAPNAVADTALDMAARRKSGEPLAYILGYTEFMGLRFDVDRATLIPRADTETIVEKAVEMIGDKKVKVLDIGTGSGCIGISIAKFCKNADVTLMDISAEALAAAEKNAAGNGVRARLLHGDIMTVTPEGKFDFIVSNPPYIETNVIPSLQTEVRDFEPLSALDGGCDGLKFYRRIASAAKDMLADNGVLMFEIGFDKAADVKKIMADYSGVRCEKDLCGNDRLVYGIKNF